MMKRGVLDYVISDGHASLELLPGRVRQALDQL